MVKRQKSSYDKANNFALCNRCLEQERHRLMDLCDGQLKLYSSVTATNVDWLWYPCIPFGKITLLQGDPGCGKSTLMMNIISAVSKGTSLPDCRKLKKPMHVIYQCSEDSAGDTIKPRLNAAGADCRNIAFLDEEMDWITLRDDRIRRAIADFNAKLLVVDPVQAYLGDADISNATGMRKMLRQLAVWASLYDCAIVLIGHQNKKENSKDLYRSLGSIDLIAAARSVVQIKYRDEKSGIRVLHHIKSSLTPKGRDLYFSIDSRRCLQWHEESKTADPVESEISPLEKSKQAQAAEILLFMLKSAPVKATDAQALFTGLDISRRTLLYVKKELGIRSARRDGIWYWYLPNAISFQEDN